MNQPTFTSVTGTEGLLERILQYSSSKDVFNLRQVSSQYKKVLEEMVPMPHSFPGLLLDMIQASHGSGDRDRQSYVYEMEYRHVLEQYDDDKSLVHPPNVFMNRIFQKYFGNLPRDLFDLSHRLVMYANVRVDAKHLLWACWELTMHRPDDRHVKFLQATNKNEFQTTAFGLIVKIAGLFDTAARIMVAFPVEAIPHMTRFSAFYLVNQKTKLRVTVSILDNKVCGINPAVNMVGALSASIYTRDLLPDLERFEMAIVLYGHNAESLRFVSHYSVLSYDDNPQYRSTIHEQVGRLESLCQFFSQFPSICNYGRAGNQQIYFAKAVAYFANMHPNRAFVGYQH